MKLLGIGLVVVSLAAGALSAATAYLVPLDLPTAEIEGLTLGADAGGGELNLVGAHAGERNPPLLKKGQVLTLAAIATLRDREVRYVKVNEFSAWRWPGRWSFAGAVAGLLGGAVVLRLASHREVVAAGSSGDAEGPDRALQAIREAVDGLRREVAGGPVPKAELRALHERLREEDRAHLDAFMQSRTHLTSRLGPGRVAELQQAAGTPEARGLVEAVRAEMGGAEVTHLDTFLQARAALAERLGPANLADLPNLLVLPRAEQARLALILERIGTLQKTHMPAFVEARPLLVARLGLGGYAELMDRYAAAERQINRAWSAAADGVPEEAVSCLDQAAGLLDEAAARLGGKG
jgi:hypothetical protein